MYTAQIIFPFLDKTSKCKKDAHSDRINILLGGWRQNGQILGRHFPLAVTPQGYAAFVNIPDQDALMQGHDNAYIKEWLAGLEDIGLKLPEIFIIGEELESDALCDCEHSDCHILYTSFLSLESPLRCGNCFGVVPLYKIPPTYDEREYYNITSWQSDFQNIDHLQMNCKVEEKVMLDLLLDYKSDLSQQGLEVCQTISDVTQKPVYYYLTQGHEAESVEAEKMRKCPSCNGGWLQEKPWHDLFDFKCDKCHLVSNIAWRVIER